MNGIDRVRARADGHCEAMVAVPDSLVWTRCGKGPIEVHHALTKARGGRILDDVGEDYHLIALCRRCHAAADGLGAYTGNILIDGYVSRDGDWITYYGSDAYLSEKYPPKETS